MFNAYIYVCAQYCQNYVGTTVHNSSVMHTLLVTTMILHMYAHVQNDNSDKVALVDVW